MSRHQVAEVAVLELLAQVHAQRQKPQPADQLGAGPARMTEPGQVVARQARPVGQQVDDAQTIGHHRVVQPEFRQVIAERTLPLSRPSSTRAPTVAAVKAFVVDPMANNVSGVTGSSALGRAGRALSPG